MHTSLEVLETRIAPAGVVGYDYNATTGVLTIDGSADANVHEITIYATGPATFRIDGNDTMLDPAGPDAARDYFDVKKLTKITYSGGTGADTLHLWGLKTLTELNFTGTAGLDKIDAFDISITGGMNLNLGSGNTDVNFYGKLLSVGGDVKVNYGGGGVVQFNATTNTLKGGVILTGGAGDDEFQLRGVTSTVGKGITFASGAGEDFLDLSATTSLTVNKAADGRAVLFTGTSGDKTFQGFNSGLLALKGTVEFTGGSDANDVNLNAENLQIDGDLKLTGGPLLERTDLSPGDQFQVSGRLLKVGGGVTVDLLAGRNECDFFTRTGTIGKGFTVMGGADADDLDIDGGSLTVTGGLTILGLAGHNVVDLDPSILTVKNALTVTGGDGADEISIGSQKLSVTLGATVTVGNGINDVEVTPDVATFSKGLTVTGGSGDDNFDIGGDVFTVTGDSTFTLGAGQNELSLGGVTQTFTGALTVTGGADEDLVEFNSDLMKVTGVITVGLFDGDNSFFGFLPSVTFTKGFAYGGGSGEDTVHFGGVKATVADMVFSLGLVGDSENSFDLNFATFSSTGALTVLGGDAVDKVHVFANVLKSTKLVKFDLGAGADEFNLFAHAGTYGNGVQLLGGADEDTLNFETNVLTTTGLFSIESGAGADTVGLYSNTAMWKGGLTVTTGDGADNVTIFADGSVTGDLTVDLGATSAADTQDQSLLLASYSGLATILKVSGALKIDSTAIDTAGHFHDRITVAELAVAKEVMINTGSAINTIDVDSITVGGNFTLNTGDGHDVVHLDTGRTFGIMSIAKITSINLGAGDDDIQIGGPNTTGTNSLVKFSGAVTVDGGGAAENNTINDFHGSNINLFAPGVVVTSLNLDTM